MPGQPPHVPCQVLVRASRPQALCQTAALLPRVADPTPLAPSPPLLGRHPNIVNFIGICRNPPCIITEYCSRGSLAEVGGRGWCVTHAQRLGGQ